MRNEIHLGVEAPCSQTWSQMSPTDQGRFCASCQKTVVNFATMDDEQVLQWFASHQGPTCGRFRNDQLGRALVEVPKPKKIHWRYWHYLIAGLLFTSEAAAQTKPNNPFVILQPAGDRDIIGDTILITEKPITLDSLRARLTDSTGNTVPYATITCGQSGTIADADGYFSIPMNRLTGVKTLVATHEVCPSTHMTLAIPSSLAPGVYFVRLSTTSKLYSQQIIVY